MPIKQKKIILRLDPSYKRCPSCGEVNVLRRSRAKNFWEGALKITGIFRMYRCRKCNWRGALSNVVLTVESIKRLAVYGLFLLFIYLLIGQVVKEFK